MRELKFRAWDRIKNEMYHNIFLDTYCHWKDNGICIENLEIMQSTGLKDRNGVEIYEGDIFDFGGGWLDVVKWHQETCGFGLYCPAKDEWDDYQFTSGSLEGGTRYIKKTAIGNIYENPELLNPRQDG